MSTLDASPAPNPDTDGRVSLLKRPWRVTARMTRTLSAAAALSRRAVHTSGDDFRAKSEIMSDMAKTFCSIHNIKVDVRGTLPPGPCVLVMNHLSWVDPFILGNVGAFQPIAKSEVAGWPAVGAIGRGVGVIFVVRGDVSNGFRVLRRCVRALASGASILNFPEGTTSRGDDVLPFYRGVFGVARIARVPVVPIRLRFETRDFCWVDNEAFLPHFMRFLSRGGERTSIEILDALDPMAFESAEALAHQTREALRRGLQPRLTESTEVEGTGVKPDGRRAREA